MKTTFSALWGGACAALLLLAPLAQAAPTAEIISSASLATYRNSSGTEMNPWGGGSGIGWLFDGNFGNSTYTPRGNGNGDYILLDFSGQQDSGYEPGYFITEIKVAQENAFNYSLYTSTDGTDWTAVPNATGVSLVGTATYAVNAQATYAKLVLDANGGWTANIAEFQVWGYKKAVPQVVSSASICKFYKSNGTMVGNNGTDAFGGGTTINNLFNNNFTENVYIGPNGRLDNGGYFILDFTESGTMPDDGWHITEIAAGNNLASAPYSLYYSMDGSTWTEVPDAQNVATTGKMTFNVNDTAKYVKCVFVKVGGWTASFNEIRVWALDPADVACTHPSYTEWTLVAGSGSCTTRAQDHCFCTVCGEEFFRDGEPLGHDFVGTVVTPGTASSYGSGSLTCSRCGFHIDMVEPINLITTKVDGARIGSVAVSGQVNFTDLTVTSTGNGADEPNPNNNWGVNPVALYDGNWTFNWQNYWYSGAGRDPEPHVDFKFATTIDLAKIEISLPNEAHQTVFYSYDEATDTETEIGRIVISEPDPTITGDNGYVTTIRFYETPVSHLRVRQWNAAGTAQRQMKISEIYPYGTVTGCGMLHPAVVVNEVHGFSTIADAVAFIEEGVPATVVLATNLVEDVVIPAGKDVTLDLDGHSITNIASDTISVYGTLTITDTIGGGEIVSALPAKADLVNYPTGTVTIQGGSFAVPDNATYYNIKNMGAMTIGGNATVLSRVSTASTLIANGWYGNATTDRGTTGQANTAILTINGGTFDGGKNVVKNDDYGILTINGGTFRNISENDAVIMNWHETTITGGTFTGATKVLVNGSYGANSADKGVMTVSGGTFTATAEGGTLFGYGLEGGHMADAVITVTGGTFSGAIQGLRDNDGTYGFAYVSGGMFDSPVPAIYCAEGYAPKTVTEPVVDEGTGEVTTPGVYGVKPVWTVSFVNDKGVAPTNQVLDVVEGVNVFATEPDPAPTATGYTFDGWFEDGAATAWDFANDAVTNDLVLTAGWSIEQCTVTFTWHDGSTTNDYDYGTVAGDVAVPRTPAPYTENGMVYTFEAWLPALADVTNDVDYVAQYSSAPAVEPEPVDLSTETYSDDEIAAGAIPAGVVTDETSGETEFVVCFHGQAGMTYTLQGSTTLNPADWTSTDLIVGTPVACTEDGQLIKLEFPMDGANVPNVMFFKIGTSRTQAAGE